MDAMLPLQLQMVFFFPSTVDAVRSTQAPTPTDNSRRRIEGEFSTPGRFENIILGNMTSALVTLDG
jgi:hypothetical protein